MSKKEETTRDTQSQYERETQLQFNPLAMQQYETLQPLLGSTLQEYLTKDSPYYNLMLQQNLNAARLLGGRGVSNVMQNAMAGGWSGQALPPFVLSQLARAGRGTAGLQANAFMQTRLAQDAMRRAALGMAMMYRPLTTGEITKGWSKEQMEEMKKTSGLGTWLPQLMGTLLMAAAGAGGFGGLFGGFGGGSSSGGYV